MLPLPLLLRMLLLLLIFLLLSTSFVIGIAAGKNPVAVTSHLGSAFECFFVLGSTAATAAAAAVRIHVAAIPIITAPIPRLSVAVVILVIDAL